MLPNSNSMGIDPRRQQANIDSPNLSLQAETVMDSEEWRANSSLLMGTWYYATGSHGCVVSASCITWFFWANAWHSVTPLKQRLCIFSRRVFFLKYWIGRELKYFYYLLGQFTKIYPKFHLTREFLTNTNKNIIWFSLLCLNFSLFLRACFNFSL